MAAVSRRYSLPIHTPLSPQRPGLSNRRRCKTVTAAFTRRDLLAATAVSSVLTLPNGEQNMLGKAHFVGVSASLATHGYHVAEHTS